MAEISKNKKFTINIDVFETDVEMNISHSDEEKPPTTNELIGILEVLKLQVFHQNIIGKDIKPLNNE